TLEVEVDMENAAALRGDLRELGREPLPSFNDLVVRAVALALHEHPGLNSSYADDRIVRYERVNVGIAVATDGGLLAPAVFDADRKSVFEIAAASRDLIERARRRAVTADELH